MSEKKKEANTIEQAAKLVQTLSDEILTLKKEVLRERITGLEAEMELGKLLLEKAQAELAELENV